MDKPISVGDLVMCLRPRRCGCPSDGEGTVFVVQFIGHSWSHCEDCGDQTFEAYAVHPNGTGCELWRLKRIDPPAQPETTERNEEAHA